MAGPELKSPTTEAGVAALAGSVVERVREIRKMLLAADPAAIEPFCLGMEQAAADLRLAVDALKRAAASPAEASNLRAMASHLKTQAAQLTALLGGWASFLTGWQSVRQCYECGYTAEGMPSAALVVGRPRGEL